MDGNLESERAAVGEAPVHDGAGEVMERTGGRGSETRYNSYRSQPAYFCPPFPYWLTISTYLSYHLPVLVPACSFL